MLIPPENSHAKIKTSNWLTIRETVKLLKKTFGFKVKASEIYRHILNSKIKISIYFQSPIVLRKIKYADKKLKLTTIENTLKSRICFLEKNSFNTGKNLIMSTEGEYKHLLAGVLDTSLCGYECVLIQRLLSRSLKIPLPIIGINHQNYGITVNFSGEKFQLYEKKTWLERINNQVANLSPDVSEDILADPSFSESYKSNWKEYFPIYDLPQDACFVIRDSEFEKLVKLLLIKNFNPSVSTRISTPLSRMFWLACKKNETICSLIGTPYKLVSIFEQWASEEGMTDRFSGDTLKTALERGSPPSLPTQK